MKLVFSLFLASVASLSLAQKKQTPQEYIDKYKELAIIEMHRGGVPASITLAQGILESSSGNSRLAKLANNHFGIKCKGGWTGMSVRADDDAPDECFRAYESVLESYKNHSEFLRANWRYHELFELDRTDYKGWCHGLRKAGYATNKQYGNILISLIERYELYQYDTEEVPRNTETGETINDIPVKIATEGETVATIASANDVKDRHIRKWNDLPEDSEIQAGDVVYLKPKRRRGSEEKHVVSSGEDMREISQLYGIKLKQLYKKNRMEMGTQPQEGEVLYMQYKRAKEDSIALETATPAWKEEPEVFVNPHSIAKKEEENAEKLPPIKKSDIVVPDFHLVVAGDNIYRIAEKYQVLEEDILTWNKNLNPSTMKIGQKIYLKKEVADKNNMSTDLEAEAKIDSPTTKKEIKKIEEEITVDGPITHIVAKGDTLYNICRRYKITVDDLKKWNDLSTTNITIGQKLQVSE
ncbi:MAG: LysM peptidoglycan-binding domain-containing protein [Bacteroidia bacterium]